MRKELVATTALFVCISVFGISSGAGAHRASTAVVNPTDAPPATASAQPSMSATAQPTAPAGDMPSATPSAAPSSAPHHVLRMKMGSGTDPDLSGHVDYTFDQQAIHESLKQIGIDTIPAHYRPMIQLNFGGLQIISMKRENDLSSATISILVVQDADEMMAKLHALSKLHLEALINPMAATKDPANKCTASAGYSVGLVKVRTLSCLLTAGAHVKMAFATIPNGEIPITVYAQSQGASVDESALKQLIKEINTDKSMNS